MKPATRYGSDGVRSDAPRHDNVVPLRQPDFPAFVISLDFEMFWGVADENSVGAYGRNIEGEWEAVPRMLALFQRYGVQATWATVGMLMCRDHAQWRDVRPALLPAYQCRHRSTYACDALARAHPRLFFARPLVESILATPGQELASHTYSHFYCNEPGATPAQFAADLACAKSMAAEFGAHLRSLVFPRNQSTAEYVALLAAAGIQAYRGNPDHWMYRDGHTAPAGLAGRAARLADAWLPLSGHHAVQARMEDGVANVPASLFLRPWSRARSGLEALRLHRLKRAMSMAAHSNRIFHLWWHPHNFGINLERNMAVLESLLQHYRVLRDAHGMRSLSMAGAALFARSDQAGAQHAHGRR